MSENPEDILRRIREQQEEITRLKRENALLHSQLQEKKRMETAFTLLETYTSEAIWTMGLDLQYRYLSPAIEKIRGFTADEVMAMPTEANVTPESMERLSNLLREELAAEQTPEGHDNPSRSRVVELEEYRKDGSTVWTEVTVAFSRDARGKPDGIVGITRDIAERRHNRYALQESERKYRLLAENISDVIWTTDLDLRFTYVSPSVQRLRGYSAEEALTQSLHDILTPDSLRKALEIFNTELPRQLQSNGEIAPYWHIVSEFEQFCRDGSTVWTESILQPMRDATGTLVGVLGVTRDISRRKKTEQLLAESRRIYKIMTENVNDVLWMTDLNLNYTFISPSMKRLCGYSSEEMLSMSVEEVLLPHSIEYVVPLLTEELAREARQTGDPGRSQTFEVEQYHKNGGTVWVEITVSYVRNEDGEAIGLLGNSRDITARKRADEEIHRLTQFQQSIIDNANVWLHVANRNGTILVWNKAAERISGYTRQEIVGHDKIWRWLYPDGPLYQTVVDRTRGIIFDNMSVEGYETTIVTKTGQQAVISWNSRALLDNDGEPFGVISLGRDITAAQAAQDELLRHRYHLEELVQERSAELLAANRELQREIAERRRSEEERARLEDQLLQAQKMEAIGQLAGGVAHDFNNVLTTISGNATLASISAHNGDSPMACLQEIHKATERAANLVRQLLAFSRKQVIELRIVDLNDIVTSLLSMLSPLLGENIELVTRLAPDPDTIRADAGSIEQIIVNLAVNARDAMPDGGTLVLSTGSITLQKDQCRMHNDITPGSYVVLSVSDNGTGIDPAIRQRIFDPFFTTKEEGKGTGLGLSTVYGIVRQHKADISVYSEPRMGTTFKILFPRATGDTDAPDDAPEEVHVPQGRETILVAEDEPMVRQLAAGLLDHLGYNVIEAADGQEALDIWNRRRSEIDLVFTDIIMPRLNGPGLAERIRTACPNARLLFASGYTPDMIACDPDTGTPPSPFIGKPYDLDELARQIRSLLDS